MKKMLLCFCSVLLVLTGVAGCASTAGSSAESKDAASSSDSSAEEKVSSVQVSSAVSTQPDSVPLAERVSSMKLAGETDKILTVVWQRSSLATATLFQKGDQDVWNEVFSTDCYIGKNGMTAEKQEGDAKTPTGAYTFGIAFGRQDDPGSVIAYHKLNENNFWVDDSNSKYYNQFVSADKVEKDWNSAEHLMAVSCYDYALSINYNTDCTPGKGSAIFLHCLTAGSTGGCVALPDELVVQLLKTVDANTRIVMVENAADLANY